MNSEINKKTPAFICRFYHSCFSCFFRVKSLEEIDKKNFLKKLKYIQFTDAKEFKLSKVLGNLQVQGNFDHEKTTVELKTLMFPDC